MTHEDMKVFVELFVEIGAAKARVEAKYADYEKCIAALTAERDSLKAERDAFKVRSDDLAMDNYMMGEKITRLTADVARLTADDNRAREHLATAANIITRLREALEKYGNHSATCYRARCLTVCSCGLDAALRPAGEQKTPEKKPL